MASRADELNGLALMHVRHRSQRIIRELESERDQLKARCDERIEAKKTALRELQEAFNECYEEGLQTARKRDQLKRERDEARSKVIELATELARWRTATAPLLAKKFMEDDNQ